MSIHGSLNTFLEKPENPKSRLPNLELTKKQHKLKLNTSHEMIRAMVSLEGEQDALKDKSNFAKSFKRMSAGIKCLSGTNKEKCLDVVAENINLYDEKNLKEVTPPIKNPEAKWSSNSTSMWMKRHGNDSVSGESRAFLMFLKNFFDALDENATGSLTANELIVPLLSLGLSNDSIYIERCLVSLFETNDLKNFSFDKEKFIGLFKGDKKVDVILKCLNSACIAMLKEEEEKKVAQQAAIKRSTVFYSQVSIAYEKVTKNKFPSVEEFIRQIKNWWAELSHEKGSVNISRIGEFLSEKGIVSNKHEGRSLAKTFDSSTYFHYHSFEKIFLKSILKASLYNIADFLNSSDCDDFSMRLKLVILQRRMMMAGVKLRNDAISKKARITLQALNKYKQRAGDSFNLSSTAKFSIEAAEELNEEKITQILFKLKQNAKQFIDECGQVKGSVKNVWDIQSSITEPEECSPTPKFKEEKYLSVLSEPLVMTANKVPYERNVKLFRENFLYKKFSKMIKVYPKAQNKSMDYEKSL